MSWLIVFFIIFVVWIGFIIGRLICETSNEIGTIDQWFANNPNVAKLIEALKWIGADDECSPLHLYYYVDRVDLIIQITTKTEDEVTRVSNYIKQRFHGFVGPNVKIYIKMNRSKTFQHVNIEGL